MVAVGEIGHLDDAFLPQLRARVQRELHIPASHVLVTASHCHGVPCEDVAERTFQVVKRAAAELHAVRARGGAGSELGCENAKQGGVSSFNDTNTSNTRILVRETCTLLYLVHGPPVFSILGSEARISENRRMKLHDGTQARSARPPCHQY